MDEKYILHVTRRYLQKEYQKKNKYGATVCEYAKNINFTKKQFDTFDMWVDFSLKKKTKTSNALQTKRNFAIKIPIINQLTILWYYG